MALLFITACKREANVKPGADVPSVPSTSEGLAAAQPGTATFTRFITVGDSQTAGYTNNGLYNAGMNTSFANIIAGQLKAVGMTSFNQPLFSAAQANGSGFLKVTGFLPNGFPVLATQAAQGVRGSITLPGVGTVPLFTKYTGALDNYGVSGLKVTDIDNALYGNANGYYERLLTASSPSVTTKYIDFVTATPYNFFLVNLGANDVLGFALNGGADASQMTAAATFATKYEALVAKLVLNGAKGVITTVPEIKGAAFFNAITIPNLSAAAGGVPIYIQARKNVDVALTSYGVRAGTATDYLLLTFDYTKIGTPVATAHGNVPYGLSPLAPIENKWVLDIKEAQIASLRVHDYNEAIKASAATHNLALVETNPYFEAIKNGAVKQDVTLSAAYYSGGVFSLDGAHLSPRGNAYVASIYITAINTKYGSTIKPIVLSAYSPN